MFQSSQFSCVTRQQWTRDMGTRDWKGFKRIQTITIALSRAKVFWGLLTNRVLNREKKRKALCC
jgi:hypothetical protein